ncbi:hypothetical protein CPB86DRAFT_814818 [Serendipita vermifera]|nr:hypothetical protein CPB86DRAFT_814818 [Serendipita vermifera]
MKHLQDMNLDLNMSEQHLRQEIRNILILFENKGAAYRELLKKASPGAPFFPFPGEPWGGWKVIAIGTFDESGESLATVITHANGSNNYIPPRGYDVVTRLVDSGYDLGGYFDRIEGKPMERILTSASSRGSVANFFCLRAPYFYLQTWVNRDTLPLRQTAFPLEPDMSFEGELYEIINTRQQERYAGGMLRSIRYGGIEYAFDGQYQTCFQHDYIRPRWLGYALRMGERKYDLIPPLLYDFNVWQTCPTDRWVKVDLSLRSSGSRHPPGALQSATMWRKMPAEIVLEILVNLSSSDVVSFTSSCRYLHHHFGNPAVLSSVLRALLRSPESSIHWFMPVAAVNGEVEGFCRACNDSWSSENNEPAAQSPDGVAILFASEFPILEFFRANYLTLSMQNRFRLWKIAQQFRQEWYKYRTEGYEYNIFELGSIRPHGK